MKTENNLNTFCLNLSADVSSKTQFLKFTICRKFNLNQNNETCRKIKAEMNFLDGKHHFVYLYYLHTISLKKIWIYEAPLLI